MRSSALRAARPTGSAIRVTVRLVEAAPVAGALRFELVSEGRAGAAGGPARDVASGAARHAAQATARTRDRSDRGDTPRRKTNKVRKRR